MRVFEIRVVLQYRALPRRERMMKMEALCSPAALEELIAEDGLLLLYFSGQHCGVCQAIYPLLVEILAQFPSIATRRIETQDAPALAAACQVFSVPAVLLFANGKETLREAGVFSLSLLRTRLARLYSLYY